MDQSSYIFGGLTIGFIVYIVVRGQLGAYLNVIGI